MLQIFKTFAEESSLLEDFEFYEKREQSHESKRNTALQPEIQGNCDSPVSVFFLLFPHFKIKVIQAFRLLNCLSAFGNIIMMIYYIWSRKAL